MVRKYLIRGCPKIWRKISNLFILFMTEWSLSFVQNEKKFRVFFLSNFVTLLTRLASLNGNSICIKKKVVDAIRISRRVEYVLQLRMSLQFLRPERVIKNVAWPTQCARNFPTLFKSCACKFSHYLRTHFSQTQIYG